MGANVLPEGRVKRRERLVVAEEWLLAALNVAWLHGCRVGKEIGRKNARTPEKPQPQGRGDMIAILKECEETLGPLQEPGE